VMIEIITRGRNLISLSLGMTLITLRSLFGNAFHREYSNKKNLTLKGNTFNLTS
jgi:hypothetical protein